MQWIVGAEHAPTLEALGREASKIEITAAFLSLEGARFVLDLSDSCPVDLTVSAFMGVTRRSALQLLLGALREPTGSGHRLRVRVARQREKGLHAKVYKFQMEDGRLVWVVGSANLTHTGLHSMGEVSVVVQGGEESEWTSALPKHMRLTKWATASHPERLEDFLEGYREAPYRGGRWEEDERSVLFLAGVTSSSSRDEELVGSIQERLEEGGDSSELNAWGRFHSETWQIVWSDGSKARWRTLSEARRGDVLLRGWTSTREVDAGVIEGLAQGSARGIDFVVAFLDEESFVELGAERCGPWRSRVLRPDEVPEGARKM